MLLLKQSILRKANRRVFRDLIISLLSTVVIASLLTILAVFWYLNRTRNIDLIRTAEIYLAQLENSLKEPIWNLDVKSISQISESYMNTKLVAKLKIIETTGNTVIYNRQKPAEKKLMEVKGVVKYNHNEIAHIEMGLSRRFAEEETFRALQAFAALVIVIILVIVGVSMVFIKYLIQAPLNVLLGGIEEIASGRYEYHFKTLHHVEFSAITEKFEQMAQRIKERETALQESEKKYRELAQSSNSIILKLDQNHRFTFVNKFAQDFFGFSEEELLGRSLIETIVPKTETPGRNLEKTIEALFDNPEAFADNENENTRKNGERVWVAWRNKSIYDNDRKMTGILCTGYDITKRKQAEEKIKASLKEKEILIDEIHHRVKNNMAVIASLLNLQSNSIEDNQIREVLKEARSRVYAMSAIHETFHGSENLSEINLKAYLSKVTTSIFQTYSVTSDKVKLAIEVEEIHISINQASPLGLVINELVSNSLKYAFPGERKGEITVSMNKLDDKKIQLIVMDDGIGMPDEIAWRNSKSLGLKLVRSLVENQLEGSINLKNNNGTKFIIKFNMEV